MNRIEKLIEEMCPEGVPTKKLSEISEIGTGSRDKKDQNPGGRHPFYVRSKTVLRSDSYEFDETAIIIPGEGGVGEIFHFQKGPYSLHQRAYRVKPNSEHVEPKFLYFFMFASFRKHIISKAVSATVTSIRKPMIESFAVPIPPLEIQKEIVNILDKFTQLEAELEAELEAREKQYEEVRRRLLDFESDNSNHPLGKMIREMCQEGVPVSHLGKEVVIKNGSDYKHLGAGSVPVFGSGGIMAHVDGFKANQPSVLIPRKGSIGNLFFVDKPFWTVDTIFYTEIGPRLEPKFLFYFLKTMDLTRLNFAGGVPSLTQSILSKIEIPIPPLEIQKEIVRILDNLDSLVNSVDEGIPAEITARRKQYEHYRDKLFSFKELDAA